MRSTLLLALTLLALGCAPDSEPATAFDPAPWVERGVAVTSASFSVMSSRLAAQLQAGGVPAAIDYCSLAAYPLTDSLSAAHSADIRRTALRYRNPANAPSDTERAVLDLFAETLASGDQPRPRAVPQEDGSVMFYAPILLAEPCTACHGVVGEDISENDYALIRERYPDDEATGFRPGDLRGMWSIRFDAAASPGP